MLLNTATVLGNFGYVALIILGIFVVKILTGAFSAAVLGMQTRVCVFCGLALAQIGEFSFVLAKSGLDAGVIQVPVYQLFLAGAVVTMAFTPFVMGASPAVVDLLYRLFPNRIAREIALRPGETAPEAGLSNHIVIAGYGITGKSVARAATLAGIPYMVIELNPEMIREERSQVPAQFHLRGRRAGGSARTCRHTAGTDSRGGSLRGGGDPPYHPYGPAACTRRAYPRADTACQERTKPSRSRCRRGHFRGV